MEPFFRLMGKHRDGTGCGWIDNFNLADFGGIEPKSGDLYCRMVRYDGQQHRQTFRVLHRVFKDHRIGVLMEQVDDLPDRFITLLEDR